MFSDRYEAGRQLASKLQRYKDAQTIVYALPRGGVLVGCSAARALKAPLDVVITRKIGHPLGKEVAICAITEDGERICDEAGVEGVDPAWIEEESAIQMREAARRRALYKPHTVNTSAKDKIAIIIDDGIATGLTMKAAIVAIRKQMPREIIVAVPVSPHETSEDLRSQVDEFIALIDDPAYKGAVGAYYRHFEEVIDEEVIACLNNARTAYLSAAKSENRNYET